MMLPGEVGLVPRRYRCGACAAEVVPLDLALGLGPRMQHTTGSRERALWLVTELSCAKAARRLDERRGLGVSHSRRRGERRRRRSRRGRGSPPRSAGR